MKPLTRLFQVLMLFACLFVVACNTGTEQITLTPITKVINTQATRLTATLSSVPQPTETSLPAISLTPPPTVTYELQEQFLQLLKTNGNCELPCFLGITPGKTKWDEANQILEKYVTGYKPFRPYENISKRGYKFYTVGIVITSSPQLYMSIQLDIDNNDIVQYILVGRENLLSENAPLLSRYSLLELLKQTGIPDEIYIGLPAQDFEHAEVSVVYEKQKIIAIPFIATTIEREEKKTKLCPSGENHPHALALASPDNPIEIKTLFDYPFYESIPSIEVVKLSKAQIQEFYNAVLKGNPDCITLPDIE
jgi:hypothetical protein